MQDSSPDSHQMGFMAAGLMERLNLKPPLLEFARATSWDFFEAEVAVRVILGSSIYTIGW